MTELGFGWPQKTLAKMPWVVSIELTLMPCISSPCSGSPARAFDQVLAHLSESRFRPGQPKAPTKALAQELQGFFGSLHVASGLRSTGTKAAGRDEALGAAPLLTLASIAHPCLSAGLPHGIEALGALATRLAKTPSLNLRSALRPKPKISNDVRILGL